MVTLDDELCVAIEPLEGGRVMERSALLARVANRVGPERAASLIDELLDDEVLAFA
jgi:hypothetical protein